MFKYSNAICEFIYILKLSEQRYVDTNSVKWMQIDIRLSTVIDCNQKCPGENLWNVYYLLKRNVTIE